MASPRDFADQRRPRDAGRGRDRSWPYRRRLLLLAAILACVGGLAMTIDLPVAAWFSTRPLPKEAMRLLTFSEAFAHGTGVAFLLVVVLVLDPTLRLPWPGRAARSDPGGRTFLRIVAATFAGGLMVDAVKAVIERVRPRAADLATLGSVWATFDVGAGLPGAGSASDLRSFPSGHAAVAAGFAAALTWRYPRGGVLFAVIAALAAMQRVASSAHYPSDIACGATLGLLGAALCLGDRRTGVESAADSCYPFESAFPVEIHHASREKAP